ncbi:hypothetical protein ACFSJ3_06285 [Corallincola platygyrae]|uniref:Uncharacterized protein n=1 Tax=Corallincola platygyrae TaxID=1193278 RepID=A0ABW4XLE7_9GAMM
MLKTTFIALSLVCTSATAIAAENRAHEALSDGVGKMMYINQHCGITIEKDKVMEVARLYLYANGFDLDIDVDWDKVKNGGQETLAGLNKEHGKGELCEDYLKQFESVLPLIQKHDAMKLDIE